MSQQHNTTCLREWSTALRQLEPPPLLTVTEWAEEFRFLSPESSAHVGKYSCSMAPYQREPQDSCNDPEVQSITLMWASQTGKTELLNNCVGYFVDFDPAPMLVMQPTIEMANTWSTDRLAPMLRDTPQLQGLVKDPRSRDSGNTKLHKVFPGGHISVVGSNAPTALASRPIRLLLADEISRYPLSAGTEGDPLALGVKRTDTFHNAVILQTSTPTVEGECRVDKEFELTDKRHWFVPCPDCGHHQTLRWEQVTWEEPESAGYRCEECHTVWCDTERREAIRNGEWRATAEFKGKRGYHLNGLYSLFPPRRGFATRLHQAVQGFLDAKAKGSESLKAWTNTFLAKTWKMEHQAVEVTGLKARATRYDCPETVLCITCGVDVQGRRLECEVVGWGEGEESYGLGYHVFPGDTADQRTWEQLERLLLEPVQTADGRELPIVGTFIDSGFNTSAVYKFVRNRQRRGVHAIKGNPAAGAPIIQNSRAGASSGVNLRVLGVDSLKHWLLDALRKEEEGPRYCHFPQGKGYDDEYFAQLGAEELQTKKKNGYDVHQWVKVRDRNEALDCRVYAIAALHQLNPNWEKLKRNKGKRVQKQKKEETGNQGKPGRVYQLRPRKSFAVNW